MAHDYDSNRHLPKVLTATMGMTTPELAAAARKACKLTLRHTAAGAWLAVCLERMESLEARRTRCSRAQEDTRPC